MLSWIVKFACMLCCFFVFVPLAMAQETVNSASVSGRVTDPSRQVVQGAQVTARQTDTNLTRSGFTDHEGRFRFPYLRVGPYEIKVQAKGFAEVTRSLSLTVGAAYELPISLAIGTTETKVTVTDEALVLEAARSQIAGTVSQTEVKSLPLNGRNFLDLALLVPGVSPTNTASTQLFPETSAVPGQGISVSSQRNFSNNFIVDGLSANDDAAGLSGIFYGLDVVHEFQVVTSGGHAEFGRALGGYINMVTKSGTNSMHGSLYGFLRNKRFNAANALSHTKLPLTQGQYGAGLGGPLIQDRTFFYSNFEQRLLNQSGSGHHLASERQHDQCSVGRCRLSRSTNHHRALSQPGSQCECPGEGRPSVQSKGSVQRPVQPLRCQCKELERRRGPERAHRLLRPG